MYANVTIHNLKQKNMPKNPNTIIGESEKKLSGSSEGYRDTQLRAFQDQAHRYWDNHRHPTPPRIDTKERPSSISDRSTSTHLGGNAVKGAVEHER